MKEPQTSLPATWEPSLLMCAPTIPEEILERLPVGSSFLSIGSAKLAQKPVWHPIKYMKNVKPA